ncbi:hypothetical protein FHX52_2223 [Humibacillus xanthopallidus]|uniref:Uncharacterized protein n=2 Tax=Humibacillus xanthopallidus TaxID=412689 RepID=A0A543PY97_9MICO|nr:hypothetical protein FHX52_2223 [Humibacillus xanthopallidus]
MIRLVADDGTAMTSSETYSTVEGATRSAVGFKSLASLPTTHVRVLSGRAGEPVGNRLAHLRSAGDLDRQYRVSIRFVRGPRGELDYRAGVALSDLTMLLADMHNMYGDCVHVLSYEAERATAGRVDWLDASAAGGTPRVRLRPGSMWVDIATEHATFGAAALGLMGAILKGGPALAALPGRTKAAWFNAQGEANLAKEKALDSAARLRKRLEIDCVELPEAFDLGALTTESTFKQLEPEQARLAPDEPA